MIRISSPFFFFLAWKKESRTLKFLLLQILGRPLRDTSQVPSQLEHVGSLANHPLDCNASPSPSHCWPQQRLPVPSHHSYSQRSFSWVLSIFLSRGERAGGKGVGLAADTDTSRYRNTKNKGKIGVRIRAPPRRMLCSVKMADCQPLSLWIRQLNMWSRRQGDMVTGASDINTSQKVMRMSPNHQ